MWRQDHNGFSHQDPGFVDHVLNTRAVIIRFYFPPDTNCLLHVADHCLASRNQVNVIVSGKQPTSDWLNAGDAGLIAPAGWRSGRGRATTTAPPM